MSDSERLKFIIQKCSCCFRKDAVVDGCLLFKERHTRIELCLGPFKDQKDRKQKIKEDFYKYKRKTKIDRDIRDGALKVQKPIGSTS